MKPTDPCGFCKRTLRPGDSFHEVIVREDDPSGREAGKYNNVCSECAGFPYSPPPFIEGSKSDVQRCGLCKRAMRHKSEYARLRFMEGDDVPFEAGLHAMCRACFDKYVPIVRERLSRTYPTAGLTATGHWLM